MFTVIKTRENWIQELSNIFLWDILQLNREIYHPPSKKTFVSTDVTFNKTESYFPILYLQGKNSIKEDKDEDKDFGSFLIDLSKVTDPIFVPSFSEPESFVSSLKSIIEQTGETMVAPEDRIIGLKEENCSL